MKHTPALAILVFALLCCCLDQQECVLPRDCEGLPHPNCTSDWLCIDNKCVWGCMECSLSLCDCKCYLKGESPEEKTGKLCGINCLGLYNVSGCRYENGDCVEVFSQENMPNPASVYCVDQGYGSEIRTAEDGSQYGVCVFPGGLECEEWEYYRGNCCVYEVSPCTNISVENMSRWADLSFSASSDSIRIEQNLSYVCCADLLVEVNRSGNLIQVFEKNVGEMCRCICGYYLNVTVPGLEPGAYEVEVYGVEFADMESELLGSALVQVPAEDFCQENEDCVPAQCCHPTYCVNRFYAPDCSGIACTEECRNGAMDCGQGRCACVDNHCSVLWNRTESDY